MNPFRTRTLLLVAAAIAVSAQASPPAASPPAAAPPTASQAATGDAGAPTAIDTAGATAIVDGIHALLVQMLGGFAPAASLLTATAQGDHYRVEIPIAHRWKGGGIGGDSIGANLIPLGHGRWRIAKGAMPGRVDVSFDHPPPGAPSSMTVTIKQNSFSGVIDTSLATESRIASHGTGMAATSQGPQVNSSARIDSFAGLTTVSPARDGRVTLVSTSRMQGMHTRATTGKQVTSSDLASAGGTLRIRGLSLAALQEAVHALATMAALPPAPPAGAPPAANAQPGPATSPAMRKELHALIAALARSGTSISMHQSQKGLVLHGNGPIQGSIGHMGFGMRLADASNELSLALDIELDHPSFAAIPPGLMTEFLPSHLVVQPRLSGIDAATLRHSLDAMVDNPQPMAGLGMVMAMLAAHPATLAIDKLAVDTGPARITGHGTVTTSGPSQVHGSGTVRVVGLDAAMQMLSADPQGKQAVAGLIFLKGLGKQEGKAMVWRVTYDGTKLLVNGNDLSSMMPGGAPAGAPPGAPPSGPGGAAPGAPAPPHP